MKTALIAVLSLMIAAPTYAADDYVYTPGVSRPHITETPPPTAAEETGTTAPRQAPGHSRIDADCGRWEAAAIAGTVTAAALGNQEGERPLWVTPGGISWHQDRSRGYNERNAGLGVEWHYRPDVRLSAGGYCNSYGKTSWYAHAAWLPLQVGQFRAGVMAGTVSGYPAHDGRFTPVAALMATWEWQRIGVNLIGVPRVGDYDAFVALQVKVRFR